MPRRSTTLALCSALTLAAVPAAAASVIYNNRMPAPSGILVISDPGESSSAAENLTVPPTGESESRVGDTITFGGPAADRFVTVFSTRLWSFQQPPTPVTVTAELTLYTRHAATGFPDQTLWSGSLADIVLATNQPVVLDFAPNITVPDTICFALSFTSVAGTRLFGVVSSSGSVPGLVGSSPNTVLMQATATQEWRHEDLSIGGGGVFRHVDAVVTAIPAPGSLVLMALLQLAVDPCRRRVPVSIPP